MASPQDMQDVLAKLRAKYVSELPDKLDDLEDIAMAIAARDAAEENMLELYRRVHSIKGSAGSYGVPIVSTICHRFEDRINEDQEDVLEGDRPFIDDALRYVDLLREAGGIIREGGTDFAGIEEKLEILSRPPVSDVGGLSHPPVSILLADTARTTAVMLRAALADRAVTLVVMDHDVSALERLMEDDFDIVICGLGIGRIGGLGLISALKLSAGRSRHATTVLLTSDPSSVPETNPSPDKVINRGPSLLVDVLAVVDAMALRPSS